MLKTDRGESPQVTKRQLRIIAVVILAATFAGINLFSQQASANIVSSAWQNTDEDLVVLNGEPITSGQYDELFRGRYGVYAHQQCTQKEVSLGPDQGSYDGCWFDTKIGEIEEGGYLWVAKDTNIAGNINNFESQLFPTPNPNVFLEAVAGTEFGEYYLNLRNLENAIMQQEDTGSDYPIYYEWPEPPTLRLDNENGEPWVVDDNILYAQIWYSNNGRWMVIQHPDGFVTRVDLETFKVLTLQASLPQEGDDIFGALDITNDGGQIAFNVYGFALRMIDATACEEYETTYVAQPQMCGMRFLGSDLEAAGLTHTTGNMPVFINNTTLRYYARGDATDDYLSYYIFAPGTKEVGNYIALGDSFASGEGIFNYFKSTDSYPTNLCHLSQKSYPYRIGALLDLTAHSVACSGARINNILGPNAKQYDIPWWSELGTWTPGLTPQKNFIQNNQPDIITVSVGGNDIGFRALLERCLAVADTCFETYEDRREVLNLVDNHFDDLVDAYKQIRAASRGSKVYVVSYPKIFSDNICWSSHMDGDEVEFANEFADYLNDTIERAAKSANVVYVNAGDAFLNQRLCDSGMVAVNGLHIRLTKNKKRLIEDESFHPNEWGHNILAEEIMNQTNNFTREMPLPEPPPDPPSTDNLLLGTPQTGRDINTVVMADDEVEEIGLFEQVTISLESAFHWLAQQAKLFTGVFLNFSVKLFSEPKDLGTVTLDPADNYKVDVNIPDDVKPGFHTLHFYGETDDGEPIDIQKSIFVYASLDDWNGNGIPNSVEGCQILPPTDPGSGSECKSDLTDDGSSLPVPQHPQQYIPPIFRAIYNPSNGHQNKEERNTDTPSDHQDETPDNEETADSNSKPLLPKALVTFGLVIVSGLGLLYLKFRPFNARRG